MIKWRQIRKDAFDAIVSSPSTHEIPREHWPDWAGRFGREVLAIYAWRTPENENLVAAGTTIADASGVMDLIAKGGSTYLYSVYRYVVKQESGQYLMSSAFKNTDYPKHHDDYLPPWQIAPGSTGESR